LLRAILTQRFTDDRWPTTTIGLSGDSITIAGIDKLLLGLKGDPHGLAVPDAESRKGQDFSRSGASPPARHRPGGQVGHYGDGDFGAACCRISAELAVKLDLATSFDFGFNADCTEMTRCECQVFNDQARRLGYESKMVGVVGHCVNIVIVPTGKGVIQRWPAGG
jgi:hypothetical protein